MEDLYSSSNVFRIYKKVLSCFSQFLKIETMKKLSCLFIYLIRLKGTWVKFFRLQKATDGVFHFLQDYAWHFCDLLIYCGLIVSTTFSFGFLPVACFLQWRLLWWPQKGWNQLGHRAGPIPRENWNRNWTKTWTLI